MSRAKRHTNRRQTNQTTREVSYDQMMAGVLRRPGIVFVTSAIVNAIEESHSFPHESVPECHMCGTGYIINIGRKAYADVILRALACDICGLGVKVAVFTAEGLPPVRYNTFVIDTASGCEITQFSKNSSNFSAEQINHAYATNLGRRRIQARQGNIIFSTRNQEILNNIGSLDNLQTRDKVLLPDGMRILSVAANARNCHFVAEVEELLRICIERFDDSTSIGDTCYVLSSKNTHKKIAQKRWSLYSCMSNPSSEQVPDISKVTLMESIESPADFYFLNDPQVNDGVIVTSMQNLFMYNGECWIKIIPTTTPEAAHAEEQGPVSPGRAHRTINL